MLGGKRDSRRTGFTRRELGYRTGDESQEYTSGVGQASALAVSTASRGDGLDDLMGGTISLFQGLHLVFQAELQLL